MELSAVQQYSTHARLLAAWGLGAAADKFRKEALEEMGHAERLIERMLAIGAAPAASHLRPVRLAKDLSSLLLVNREFEAEIVTLYESAVRHCASEGDKDNYIFFDELLKEERHHHAELDAWLKRLQE